MSVTASTAVQTSPELPAPVKTYTIDNDGEDKCLSHNGQAFMWVMIRFGQGHSDRRGPEPFGYNMTRFVTNSKDGPTVAAVTKSSRGLDRRVLLGSNPDLTPESQWAVLRVTQYLGGLGTINGCTFTFRGQQYTWKVKRWKIKTPASVLGVKYKKSTRHDEWRLVNSDGKILVVHELGCFNFFEELAADVELC